MKRFILAATTLATGLACSYPAYAMDDDYYNSRQSSATVGFYLHVPLGGTAKAHRQKPYEYGFALQVNRSYHNAYGARTLDMGFQNRVVALKFGPEGFDNLSLAGRGIVDRHGFMLAADGTEDGTGKKSGGVNWVWVGIGALVVVGGLAYAAGKAVNEIGQSDTQN